MKLSIILLGNDKPFFEGDIPIQEEVHFDFFSLRVLSEEKIVVLQKDKKFIIYFSEIFKINYMEYVILNRDNMVNIISYYSGENDKFECLIQNNFKVFFLQMFRALILSYSLNEAFCFLKKLVKKLSLPTIAFLFFLTDKNIALDKVQNRDELLIQRNIYQVYKEIMAKAKPENTVTFSLQKKQESLSISQKLVHHSHHVKNSKPVIKEKIDNEIQYFMHFQK